tara:strand:- start:340 stop:603 length:264 start_codon:yes stop_codon:yes gene_type:complete
MPVYDYGRTEMDANKWPDQVCVVLEPQQSKTGDAQSGQSGSITIEGIDTTAYLPVYLNYQTAMQEHPNVPIYVLSLVDFKRKLGMLI